jgi:ketosteroid isomerase-like protein
MAALALAVVAACAGRPAEPPLRGAESPGSALYETVRRMDDSLSTAFNAHDVPRVMALFTPDLECYHDPGGLQSHADVRAGFSSMFTGGTDIRRDLVAGTFRVYPIRNYGAIEVGTHRFCHTEKGRPDCGAFAFLHVWRQTGDTWRLARVVSYGH